MAIQTQKIEKGKKENNKQNKINAVYWELTNSKTQEQNSCSSMVLRSSIAETLKTKTSANKASITSVGHSQYLLSIKLALSLCVMHVQQIMIYIQSTDS